MNLVFKSSQTSQSAVVFSFTAYLKLTPAENKMLNHYNLLKHPLIEGHDLSPIARFYVWLIRPLLNILKLAKIFDAILLSSRFLTTDVFMREKGWTFSSSDIDEVLKKRQELETAINNLANALNSMVTYGADTEGEDVIEYNIVIPPQLEQ